MCLTGNEDVTHWEWGCDSPGMHIVYIGYFTVILCASKDFKWLIIASFFKPFGSQINLNDFLK